MIQNEGSPSVEGRVIGAIIFFTLQQQLSSYGVWYLTLMGAIAIFMTVQVRQGIWGLVAARTRLRLFPVGYRVELTAAAGAPAPAGAAGKAASGRPRSPRSTALLNPGKRRQR